MLQIGPFALSIERLAAVVAIGLFLAWSEWIARRTAAKAATAAWIAIVAGIVTARLAYVAINLEAFRAEPLAVAYVWQGGFEAAFGIAAAALILALMLRGPERRMSLAALVLVTVAWVSFSAISGAEPERPMPPLAGVTDVGGTPVAGTAVKGPMVVNLWATWCPPCRREMPRLQEVAASSPDVPIVLLNQAEQQSQVQRYLHDEGIDPALVLIDPAGRFAAEVGATALPTTLFVDAKGRIVRTHSGEISRAALLSGIRELRRRCS